VRPNRELSAKVFAGQCRLIEIGYRSRAYSLPRLWRHKTIDFDGLVIRFIDHGVVEENWTRLIDVLLWYGILGYAKDADESIHISDTSYNLKLL